jgi:ML domain
MLVYGVIARIDIPFPLPNPNACSNSNVACPVQAGQLYKYQNYIFVKEEYPSVSFDFLLQDNRTDMHVKFSADFIMLPQCQTSEC